MITKIPLPNARQAPRLTVIAWGREPDALIRLTRGADRIGTLLIAQTQKTQARKQ